MRAPSSPSAFFCRAGASLRGPALGEAAAAALPFALAGAGAAAFLGDLRAATLAFVPFALLTAAASVVRPWRRGWRYGWAALWAGAIAATPWRAWQCELALFAHLPLNPERSYDRTTGDEVGAALAAGGWAFVVGALAWWLLPRAGARVRRVAAGLARAALGAAAALTARAAVHAARAPALGAEPVTFPVAVEARAMPGPSIACGTSWATPEGARARLQCATPDGERVRFEVTTERGFVVRRDCFGPGQSACAVAVCAPWHGPGACAAAPSRCVVNGPEDVRLHANERLGVGVLVAGPPRAPTALLLDLADPGGSTRTAVHKIAAAHRAPLPWLVASAYGVALAAWALVAF